MSRWASRRGCGDTAATGRTDASGKVTLSLDALPSEGSQGTVTLEIWHPRLPDNTRPVTREIERDSESAIVTLNLEPEPAAEGSLDRLQQRFREL